MKNTRDAEDEGDPKRCVTQHTGPLRGPTNEISSIVKPTTRSVKIWMEGADSFLQHQFQHTNWSMFATKATIDSHTNIIIYTNSVLEHINSCVDRLTTDAAFRSGDQEDYSSARANLRRSISKAKHFYKQQIEEHFNSSDPWRMWQGRHSITDFIPPSTMPLPTVPHSLISSTTPMLASIGEIRWSFPKQIHHLMSSHSSVLPDHP
ncbi:hypothetical protein AOLI_G00101190 [Acnodon oligacanthus]